MGCGLSLILDIMFLGLWFLVVKTIKLGYHVLTCEMVLNVLLLAEFRELCFNSLLDYCFSRKS